MDPIRTPSGKDRRYESRGAYRPFTKTTRLVFKTPNPKGSSFSATTPSGRAKIAGLNGARRKGAMFVYFHSSCFCVGNPRDSNRAIAFWRNLRSHLGPPRSFSDDAK